MAKRRILLDMTDFANWQGHFTGIQRVIYEVGSRLLDHDEFDVQCFVYDEPMKKFFVTNDSILRLEDADIDTATESVDSGSGSKYKNILVKSAKRLTPLKPLYHKSRHYAGVAVNRYLRPARAKALSKLRTIQGHSEELVFRKTDVVLILGAGWHKRTMSDEIARRKQELEFKLATLIHDAIPLIKPELFGVGLPEVYAQFMFETMIASDAVFAISDSTKNDIINFCNQYNIDTPKIIVVREGDGFKRTNSPKAPLGVSPGEQYILAVGSFEVRKNYILLYQAYKEAARLNLSLPRLIIVGRKGWLSEDLSFLIENDQSLVGKISHLSNISDEELGWLYENCLFTVYPSMYEGWGLPVAESLFYGKFCISSSESSMPEVAGSLAEYVSPYDAVGLMKLMMKYSHDTTSLRKREDKIQHEYVPVTWNKCAEHIIGQLDVL